MVDGDLRVGVDPLLRVNRLFELTHELFVKPLVLDNLCPADFWCVCDRVNRLA